MDTSFEGDHVFLDGMGAAELDVEVPRDSGGFPIKKLSDVFDNCAKSMPEGSMKVYLRVRPSSSKVPMDCTIKVESDTTLVTNAPESSRRAQYTKTEERHYAFTRVFGCESQQVDVYNHVAVPLLERFLQGESCVLFAYGMTNAGKTYTIQGTPHEPGILPLLVNAIIKRMAGRSDFSLQTSMLEIYQEKIFDLLGSKRDKLLIRDGNGRVEVVKLSSHPISSSEDAIKLMDAAASRRSKANTFLNTGSSRSHAVYTITLNQIVNGSEQSAIFQVVDLAGAERGSRTKAGASQQKEANIINMSLMQLWRCLQAMKRRVSDGANQPNMDIIPFRESKLTHLLMPLLGRVGLAGMAMLTCVNPQIDDYDETLSILSNASLACKIKEITDLGRTTVGVVGVHAGASATGPGPTAQPAQMRKTSSSLAQRSSSLLNNQARANQVSASVIKRNSSKGSVASLDPIDDATLTGRPAAPTINIQDETLLKEMQRLRDEVTALKSENRALLVANFEKETEIREEVANEMAKRSMHLLEQIQELQEQLDAKTDHFHDVTKSCKKARKKQMEIENAETAKDLKEAEEELERVKVQYESELEMMRNEKHELELELEDWREKAEVAMAKVGELTSQLSQQLVPVTVFEAVAPTAVAAVAVVRTSRSGSLSMPIVMEESVAAVSEEIRKSSAAEQFSQRISRDQRFQKKTSAHDASATQDSSSNSNNSPKRDIRSVRSPLKHIDGNSPNKPAINENDKKRALSPKSIRCTSPLRKLQAVEVKQPVMKSSAVKENHSAASAAANKRPLRSTLRAL